LRAEDLDLARKAREKGWIADDQVRGVLAEADRYQALGLEKGVDEILLERGLLVAEQVKELREALGLNLKSPRIGDYEVIRRIGMGGMGTVFESRHVRLAQRIALKVLQPRHARDPQTAERFLTEARTLARLNHPNLVHAMDAGKDGDIYYLAMELVAGENLLQVVMRDGPLEPLRSLAIVKDVCRALGALEEKGLVHRDVKPANILVSPGGKVHLADFGLLAAVEDGAQEAGPLCGTPHYLAPEQAQRQGIVDHRSDLYSLAATWYHVLVGRPPFVGKSTREIVRAHLQQAPAPPSSLRPGIPRAMEALILRWLAKDKGQRPASCRAALAELEAIERSLTALPRRRARVVAGLVLAMVLLGGGLAIWRPWLTAPMAPAPGPAVAAPAAPAPAEPPATTTLAPAALPGPRSPPPAAAPAAPTPARVAVPGPQPAALPPAEAIALPAPPPATEPFLAAWRSRLAGETRRVGRGLAARLTGLQAEAADFRGWQRLGATFHAARTFLAPGPSSTFLLRLEYDFDGPEELRDFRWRPGTWRLESGALQRASAGPEATAVWTVSRFVTPLRIEGVLGKEAPLVIGLGALRIAPGAGDDAQLWLAAADEERRQPPVPAMPRGAFWLEISAREVELSVGSRSTRKEAPGTAEGRILLEGGGGAVLEALAIEGFLEPIWAAARLETVKGLQPGDRR
jgi:serine/threonine-protein kinase